MDGWAGLPPCSVAIGYQRFGGTCYLHLQGEVKNATQLHNPEDLDMNLRRRENLKYRISARYLAY